jgi:hypothetical protein
MTDQIAVRIRRESACPGKTDFGHCGPTLSNTSRPLPNRYGVDTAFVSLERNPAQLAGPHGGA